MINILKKKTPWPAVGKTDTAYLNSFNEAVLNFEMVLNDERIVKSPSLGRIIDKHRDRV